jgi:hypothetical protein
MQLDGADGIPGLREVLTSSYGRGLDCDGVFLDTIDTAAPNSYTDWSSPIQTKYEWTAPGFASFIKRVHQTYPDKLVLQNRGLFFFDPRHPHYQWNPRGAVDIVLFESLRLNSNPAVGIDPYQYPDNRYNITPKLMAEANRPDGFKVLSLGYAAGPPAGVPPESLLGQSSAGLDSLMEDIQVAHASGFRHYFSDSLVRLVNEFVRTHANMDDRDPPQWTSTYNDQMMSPPVAPTPRVGIQQAVPAGGGKITVRWDVALDENRVHYVLYASPQPFDFAADPALASATVTVLVPEVPADYKTGVGPDRYPYQATVGGFPGGQTQYLVIRAVDESPNANQDPNTVVLTATP